MSARNSLTEIVPALCHNTEHHRAKRVAILKTLLAFISETGDGEFAFLCGDLLQHLPESRAYLEDMIELDGVLGDRMSVRDGMCFRDLDLMRHEKVLSLLAEVGINLTLAEVV